jgi:D-tyrosyl-tRNA(Tyr) deacylase
MRVVLQRVVEARVVVDGSVTGEIDHGLLLLLGVAPDDTERQVQWMAKKLANLRIFSDAAGKMNRSLLDCGGGALVVSQFTLYGDTKKGRRPSFNGAAPPELAEPLYQRFCEALAAQGVTPVQRGVFGAHMTVSLVNDGPVTLVIDSE